jgi:pimeloyl-ACP methyl ester carboxylesterase
MTQNIHERSWQTDEQYVDLGDATVHVARNGAPDAPVLVLIHGLGAATDWWNPVVPCLADTYRVIRVDLPGHGRSTGPAARTRDRSGNAGYSIPAHAARVGAVLDELGVTRVAVVVGHSSGGSVAAELAAQRPEAVTALALISTGPSREADTSDSPLSRLLFARFPGRLLWRLLRETIISKSMSTAFARPALPVPDTIMDGTRGMTHHALAETALGSVRYLEERPLPERLAGLGKPLLVVFGAEDARWRSASAEEYRVVPGAQVVVLPGVGHTPMYEDPQRTCELLLGLAAAAVGPGPR